MLAFLKLSRTNQSSRFIHKINVIVGTTYVINYMKKAKNIKHKEKKNGN